MGRGGTGETYRDKCLRRFVPAVLEACWRTKLSKFSSFFRRKVQIVNLKGSGEAEKTLGGGNGRLKRPIVVSVRRHFCLFLFFFPKFLCEHTLSIFWKPLYTFYFFVHVNEYTLLMLLKESCVLLFFYRLCKYSLSVFRLLNSTHSLSFTSLRITTRATAGGKESAGRSSGILQRLLSGVGTQW